MTRIPVRPGEKAYEELMTEEESLRARDIGAMYAVLPPIDTPHDLVEAYADAPLAPVGRLPVGRGRADGRRRGCRRPAARRRPRP